MRDAELNDLLAAADREFQRALHARSAGFGIEKGLVAILGNEPDEVSESRMRSPQRVIAQVPESLFLLIDGVLDLLDEDPAASEDAFLLLAELEAGLDHQVVPAAGTSEDAEGLALCRMLSILRVPGRRARSFVIARP